MVFKLGRKKRKSVIPSKVYNNSAHSKAELRKIKFVFLSLDKNTLLRTSLLQTMDQGAIKCIIGADNNQYKEKKIKTNFYVVFTYYSHDLVLKIWFTHCSIIFTLILMYKRVLKIYFIILIIMTISIIVTNSYHSLLYHYHWLQIRFQFLFYILLL